MRVTIQNSKLKIILSNETTNFELLFKTYIFYLKAQYVLDHSIIEGRKLIEYPIRHVVLMSSFTQSNTHLVPIAHYEDVRYISYVCVTTTIFQVYNLNYSNYSIFTKEQADVTSRHTL